MEETQIGTRKSWRAFFNKISFGLLLSVIFLAPLFFVPLSFISTQFGTSLLFAFVVIVVALIYIISALLSGSIELPRSTKYVTGFMVVVPVVYLLAGIANGFSRMAFFGYTFDISTVGFIILAFAFLFLISIFFRDKKRIFHAYFAFVLSAVLVALFLLIRLAFGAKVLSFGIFNDLTSTIIGSWNNVGIFFGIATILFLLAYQMLRVSKSMKILLTIGLIVSMAFVALVNFTVIWIIMAICAFLYILYTIFSSQSSSIEPLSFTQKLFKIPFYPFAVLAISVIFAVWGTTAGAYLSNTLHVSNVGVRPSLGVTLNIARETLKTRPLFGYGPNTFVNQWLTWKPDNIVTTIFWNTDFANGIGLIPTFAVTTGILGVLSWLLFLGFFVYLGVKSIFVRMEDPFIKYLITSSFFVSVYLWAMAFAYVPSAVIFILTVFFSGLFFASVYLAGFIRVETRSFSMSPRTGFLSSLALVAFFVAGSVLGYGLFQNLRSLWYFQKSSYALNTVGDSAQSEMYMNKALSAVPNDIYYRALSEIELYKLNQVASQDTQKVKAEVIQKQFKETMESAIKAGLAAKDADPDNYLNWIALGRVYESVSQPELQVQGAYESAGLAYTEALKHNPKNPSILVIFARLAVTHKDLKLARQYALQAIQAKQNYLDAYFLLSQIEVADNNIGGAIDSVSAASVIDPTNPAVFFQLGLLKYNVQDFKGAITALEQATKLTPDYANAKYFLGLSYEITRQHDKAVEQFRQLRVTNPDSQEVNAILANLEAGKPIFTSVEDKKPEKGKALPVAEKQ